MNMQTNRQTTKYNDLKSGENVTTTPKVLLAETFRWPFVALFALDLANAGCHVSFVCSARHPALKTRAVRQTFPYSALRPLESLEVAIEAASPDFIVPCDDRAVENMPPLYTRA